jgi:tartrate dehydrogenase/decarboxylase/D-malate dehydrogenase
MGGNLPPIKTLIGQEGDLLRKYSIAVLPGDGVGPEVTTEAQKALAAAAEGEGGFGWEWREFPWGSRYYLETGKMMPDDALKTLGAFDAILLGAVGHPDVPDHITLWGMLLPIRQFFQQYVNLRPVKLLEGIISPLQGRGPADIDMIFVRENTEGEYAGIGGRLHEGTPAEVALQTSVFTRQGTERVMRYAFSVAKKRARKQLVSVTKSNACNYSMVFWDQVFREVSADYPAVFTSQYLVDAMAAALITNPGKFDVVVASNLFGDVLTDIGSAIMGSLGLGASANLDPSRRYPSMFEPVHGSAPDIMGRGIANPLGAVAAASMMLEHLGESSAAERIQSAVASLVREGRTLTPDLGGRAGTAAVGDELARRVKASYGA